MKILVLGGTGMLGLAVVSELRKYDNLSIHTTFRQPEFKTDERVSSQKIDLSTISYTELEELVKDKDVVINCAGLIKQKAGNTLKERMFFLNSIIPVFLNDLSKLHGNLYIQIGTDCVFRGTRGHYIESDSPDAIDDYGLSKKISESVIDNALVIRSSIIGLEQGNFSLLGWFLSQPYGAKCQGYENHKWNGVTTLDFAAVVSGIIRSGIKKTGLFHLVPSDQVTKVQLLTEFQRNFNRPDIEIIPVETTEPIDRTLGTIYHSDIENFWQLAGYTNPPSIPDMIKKMAKSSFAKTQYWGSR
jgi:dTDP-4-dehydrorhamnose reductase